MSESLQLTIKSSEPSVSASVWAKHVKSVDLSLPGAFSLGGSFIGGLKSSFRAQKVTSFVLQGSRLPGRLFNGEAIVIGVTFTVPNNSNSVESKIAIVFTGEYLSFNNPFSAFTPVVAQASMSYVQAVEDVLGNEHTVMLSTDRIGLNDIYKGDMIFASTAKVLLHFRATLEVSSPYNTVAEILKKHYNVPEADLSSEYERVTRKSSKAGQGDTNLAAQRFSAVSAYELRKHINHNGKKLAIPKSHEVMFLGSKDIAILKHKSSGKLSFLDALVKQRSFASDENWESFLEQQARSLEAIAMAYRIIAQMKAKSKKKGE